jgi:hypothetical protein
MRHEIQSLAGIETSNALELPSPLIVRIEQYIQVLFAMATFNMNVQNVALCLKVKYRLSRNGDE